MTARNILDELLHAVSGFTAHLLSSVSVNIQGERCRGMTKVALYGFDVVTVFNRSHCIAVTQIMEAGIIQPQTADNFLKLL